MTEGTKRCLKYMLVGVTIQVPNIYRGWQTLIKRPRNDKAYSIHDPVITWTWESFCFLIRVISTNLQELRFALQEERMGVVCWASRTDRVSFRSCGWLARKNDRRIRRGWDQMGKSCERHTTSATFHYDNSTVSGGSAMAEHTSLVRTLSRVACVMLVQAEQSGYILCWPCRFLQNIQADTSHNGLK